MYDPEIQIRHGAFLPHWTKEGAIYHVRIRLGDSLPQQVLQAWAEEKKGIIENAVQKGRALTQSEQKHLEFLHSEKVEKYLDAGHGACLLRQDDVAGIFAQALRHFNDQDYKLFAWCIMPNHVHVVVKPLVKELHEIVYSWKWFTAMKANAFLNRRGTFWQREYFDHLLRNQESLERTVEYVWANPEEAGLRNWKWRWRIDRT